MELPATRHSIIAAVCSGDARVRRDGFETLVAVYWKPAYKYLRLKWHASSDDAKDVTQEFFARAIEKGFFDAYDPSKSRFRTFLRLCLDRFMSNERKAAGRLKRGGGVVIVPLDFENAEGELGHRDVAIPNDLDEYFHQEWLRSLLSLAVDDLRAEYERESKVTQFQVWKRYDLDAPMSLEAATYAGIAREYGVSSTDVTNYLAAARRAFRRLLLERLRAICADEEFESEARFLLRGGFR